AAHDAEHDAAGATPVDRDGRDGRQRPPGVGRGRRSGARWRQPRLRQQRRGGATLMAINPDDPDLCEPRAKADRSITALLSDLASETILLIRQERALLKAELPEKFSRIGQGATALGAGALIAFSGWLGLLAAAVLGLATVVA